MGFCSEKIRTALLAAGACVYLAACTHRQPDVIPNIVDAGFHIYTNTDLDYSFSVPSNYTHQNDDEEGMYFGYADTSQYGHFFIQSLDNPHEVSVCTHSNLCTDPSDPSLIEDPCGCNVADPELLAQSEDTFTVMGKFPGYGCSVDHCDDTKFGMSEYKGRYVLYSTHRGQTVKIEVNQITDNPALAEEIFKTFKWTK